MEPKQRAQSNVIFKCGRMRSSETDSQRSKKQMYEKQENRWDLGLTWRCNYEWNLSKQNWEVMMHRSSRLILPHIQYRCMYCAVYDMGVKNM